MEVRISLFIYLTVAYYLIRSQVTYLRKIYGSRLNVFAPVHDLSAFSKLGSEGLPATAGLRNDMTIAGGQILGDEYTDHVVKVSSFMIHLKAEDSS